MLICLDMTDLRSQSLSGQIVLAARHSVQPWWLKSEMISGFY